MPTLSVRQAHPALGAEVRGIDISLGLDDATAKAVHDAWMQHLVLIFPGQAISDEAHVAFTCRFGEPEIFHQNIIKSQRMPEIFRLANVDEDGHLMPPAHPTLAQIAQAQRWHTDSSYRTVPAMGSILHGIEITREGGETCFINMYRVYDALPDGLRRQIEGRKARHNFEHLHTAGGLKPLTDEERASMPPVWQPMVRRHPVTGRKSLYVSPIYNDGIEGMGDAETMALIGELVAFASQPQFVYRHKWTPDDIVMWDNRCTMHLVTPHDPSERRVMHRTTIIGDGPVMAG